MGGAAVVQVKHILEFNTFNGILPEKILHEMMKGCIRSIRS